MKHKHKSHELFSVHCNGDTTWDFRPSCTKEQLLEIAETILNKLASTNTIKVKIVEKGAQNDQANTSN